MADIKDLPLAERERLAGEARQRVFDANPHISPEDWPVVERKIWEHYGLDPDAPDYEGPGPNAWPDEEFGVEPPPQNESIEDDPWPPEESPPSAEEDTETQNSDDPADCGSKGCGTADAPVDVGSLVWDFAVGVVQGAAMAAATVAGLAAIAGIPVVGTALAAVAGIGLLGYGLYGIYELARNYDKLSTSDWANLAGNFVGGFFGGWAAGRGLAGWRNRKPKLPPEEGQPKPSPENGPPQPDDGQPPKNPSEESPSGNQPPDKPPKRPGNDTEPPPKRRKRYAEDTFDPVARPGHTKPSGNGRLSGEPKRVPDKLKDPEQIADIVSENRDARSLAERYGYDVEQLTESKIPGKKNPDYNIEGRQFDQTSARTGTSAENIAGKLFDKVDAKQAQRFVLNLSRSDVSPQNVINYINEINAVRIQNGEPLVLEVIIMRGGEIVAHFP